MRKISFGLILNDNKITKSKIVDVAQFYGFIHGIKLETD